MKDRRDDLGEELGKEKFGDAVAVVSEGRAKGQRVVWHFV